VVIELEDGRKVKTAPAKIKLVREDARKSGERTRPDRGMREAVRVVPTGSVHARRGASGPSELKASEGENPWYEVTLIEGRNRQIRRMFEKVGHHVEKIRRVRMGPLKLDVEVGKFRELSAGEIQELKRATEREGGKGSK
jgi:23S rRNA pseudouridine2605 synthase